MNRKEEIKRLPFIVSAYKQIYRSESVLRTSHLQESKRRRNCITPLRYAPRNFTALAVGYKLAHG